MLTLLGIDETMHSTLQERAIISLGFDTFFFFLQNNHSAVIR